MSAIIVFEEGVGEGTYVRSPVVSRHTGIRVCRDNHKLFSTAAWAA